MPPIGVLIKPASSKCNLRCRYCFYRALAESRSVRDYGFMSEETLEAIVRKVLEFAEHKATFSFQGGEPTLCGLDFYRRVVALQKRYNVNNVAIKNCLQTNGVLLDEEWAEFLRDNDFLVGLSLDGPADIHDANRVDREGKGTYHCVMKAAGLLRRHGVEHNILFVVTAQSARFPDKIYGFFKRNDFRFLQFIPCIVPEGRGRRELAYSLEPKPYAEFLKTFFDRWSEDFLRGREISVRYFDNLVRMVLGARPETCSMLGMCRCQFVFEADGSAYPCDFYATDRWRIGNIREDSLMEMHDSGRCREFVSSSATSLSLCRSCRHFDLCRGGCRRDRENSMTGAIGRNVYCQAYSEFLEYAFPKLIAVARHVARAKGGKRPAAHEDGASWEQV